MIKARIDECILYRDFQQGEILEEMADLINTCAQSQEELFSKKTVFFKCVNALAEMAGLYGFSGNLWHNYLTFLLVNHENAFSTACEIKGTVKGSINACLLYTSLLLMHPVSRKRFISEKLIAVFIQITAMNILIYVLSIGSIAAVGETIPWKEISLIHLAYYLLQMELAGICFGISAFLRKGSVGAGLGIAAMMYFLNLIADIADVAEFLKYITPFGYCEGADIMSNGSLDGVMVFVGTAIGIGGIAIAYFYYTKKDIH